jgi:protein-tyrosine phosphatase
MPTILFICTANQFRSPIAAAYAERKLQEAVMREGWVIASAGTWTSDGLPAHEEAMAAAELLGLDLSHHLTSEVNGEGLEAADVIVVMERGQKEALEWEFAACRGRVALLGELAGEAEAEIPDPAKSDFEDGEAVAGRIVRSIDAGWVVMLRIANKKR